MSQARVIYFGLSAVYLVAVAVQFFLAGLGAFGAEPTYDSHRVLGFILAAGSLVLLAVAIVGRLPRVLLILTVGLVALNVLQIVLANVDVQEVAALHPVNALAIVFLAHVLMQRSRRYLASKITA
jgi:Family of unknown function (DUF6220)